MQYCLNSLSCLFNEKILKTSNYRPIKTDKIRCTNQHPIHSSLFVLLQKINNNKIKLFCIMKSQLFFLSIIQRAESNTNFKILIESDICMSSISLLFSLVEIIFPRSFHLFIVVLCTYLGIYKMGDCLGPVIY